MAILTYTVVAKRDGTAFAAAVQAAITGGAQPFGQPFMDTNNECLTQVMITGSQILVGATGAAGADTTLDTDSTMAANSDLVTASQKAIKTALATKPTAAIDTDGTLAANSDVKVASQKATKTAIAAVVNTITIRHAAGVPSGAPTTTEAPVAFDSTASTGGVYLWTGAAWVQAALIP